MELFYTFIFDITVMKATFSISELVGVSLIVIGNLYMYFINSFSPEEEEDGLSHWINMILRLIFI